MLSGADVEHTATKDGGYDKSHREDDMNAKIHDESESLSDIDDLEVLNQSSSFFFFCWLLFSSDFLQFNLDACFI